MNNSQTNPTPDSDLAAMAKHELGDALGRGRMSLSEMQQLLISRTRECARQTNSYVQQNPWRSIGLAVGLGLIVGLILKRR